MRIISFTIIFSLLIPSCESKRTGGEDTNKNSCHIVVAKNTLSEFYARYIEYLLDTKPNDHNLDLLQKSYCSREYYHFLVNDTLYYDPFINGQDVQSTWAESIQISQSGNGADCVYSVCFYDSYEKDSHCISVTMIFENGGWKIDNTE